MEKLPVPLLGIIYSYLEPKERVNNSFLTKKIKQKLANPFNNYLWEHPVIEEMKVRRHKKLEFQKKCEAILAKNCIFGAQKWSELFKVKVDGEPRLTKEIVDMLDGPCPFFGASKVMDTHMLVLIPSHVNGKPYSHQFLYDFKHDKNNRGIYLRNFDKNFSIKNSYWVLMTKKIIPQSKGLIYEEQAEFIRPYEKKGYQLPKIIEAATCIFMKYLSEKESLYGSENYIGCSDGSYHKMKIGGFGGSGCVDLSEISFYGNNTESYGYKPKCGSFLDKTMGTALLKKLSLSWKSWEQKESDEKLAALDKLGKPNKGPLQHFF